jgi:hypothetical protein
MLRDTKLQKKESRTLRSRELSYLNAVAEAEASLTYARGEFYNEEDYNSVADGPPEAG